MRKVNVDSIDNSVNIKLNNSEELILNEIKKILDSIQENNKEKKNYLMKCVKILEKNIFRKVSIIYSFYGRPYYSIDSFYSFSNIVD